MSEQELLDALVADEPLWVGARVVTREGHGVIHSRPQNSASKYWHVLLDSGSTRWIASDHQGNRERKSNQYHSFGWDYE